MEDPSGRKKGLSEARGHGNVVVPGRLVCCDQNRQRLAHMDVDGGVRLLEGVCPFHFDQPHLVALKSHVEGALQSHI